MTEVLVFIAVSDLNKGSFSENVTFSRNRSYSCGKWLWTSVICASSLICPHGILNVQFRYFSVASLSSRAGKRGGFEISTHGNWPRVR